MINGETECHGDSVDEDYVKGNVGKKLGQKEVVVRPKFHVYTPTSINK